MRIRVEMFCAVLAILGSASLAQAQPPAAAADTTSQPVPMTLDVAVTDKAGNPVQGLQQSDFTLLDDKHHMQIQGFQPVSASGDNTPLVVLIFDEVNDPLRALSIGQTQVEQFLTRDQGHLPFPVALMFFTDTGLHQLKPSRDGNELAALLSKHRPDNGALSQSTDFYASSNRFSKSVEALESILTYEASVPQRKFLVWISSGWPTLNLSGQMPVKMQRQYFQMVVTTSNLLRATDTTVDAVDPEGNYDAASMRTVEWQNYTKPVSHFDKAFPGNLALQVLAQQSGGQIHMGGNNIAEELARCAQDATSWYQITFQPQAADKPNTWHPVEVKVDRRGVDVRTRDGYYAQP